MQLISLPAPNTCSNMYYQSTIIILISIHILIFGALGNPFTTSLSVNLFPERSCAFPPFSGCPSTLSLGLLGCRAEGLDHKATIPTARKLTVHHHV